MRNTKQKELIFKIISSSYNHLTAQEVYTEARKEIDNISLGTVYRILNNLADNHQIVRIKTKSGVDHYDRKEQEKHNHFICDNCGKIFDVYNAEYLYDDKELSDFQINNVDITFSGICNECIKGRN